MFRWKLTEDDKCECGYTQTMQYLLVCPNLPTCNTQDLLEANNQAVEIIARYWQEII
jgi:hypothetical protein